MWSESHKNLMEKIIIATPPGCGNGFLLQVLSVLVGELDEIKLALDGSTHISDNIRTFNSIYSLPQEYLPFKSSTLCTEIGELIPINTNQQYVFILTHYTTQDIIKNIDNISDWRLLFLTLNKLDEIDLAVTLNAIKYKQRTNNFSLKRIMLDSIKQARYIINDKVYVPFDINVPENIIESSYFDFYTDPVPFLRRLVPSATPDRLKKAESCIREYWNKQFEDL